MKFENAKIKSFLKHCLDVEDAINVVGVMMLARISAANVEFSIMLGTLSTFLCYLN